MEVSSGAATGDPGEGVGDRHFALPKAYLHPFPPEHRYSRVLLQELLHSLRIILSTSSFVIRVNLLHS